MASRISVSGRMANLISRALPGVGKAMSRRQAAAYERSGGTKSAAFMGKPTFRLTVRGRKSGEPRSVMLMLVRDEDDLIVVGSQAGVAENPNWWKNLVAAGEADVQVGADTWHVRAAEVTDPAERARAWRLACDVYPDFDSYRQLTDRTIPVAVLTRAD